MIGFEVYRNGEKLCTAGIGDFGVLSAILSWVSHDPEKLKRWAASGMPETEPTTLKIEIGALHHSAGEPGEHLKWLEEKLAVGDELRIRIVDVASADPPSSRKPEDDPATIEEKRKKYVRREAKEFGWKIVTEANTKHDVGES